MEYTDKSLAAYNKIQKQFCQQKEVCIYPQGSSMWPLLIEKRDCVTVMPASLKTWHRGDVMLYQRNDYVLVLHRLHHKDKRGYYFVGDNQTAIEGPLRKEQLLGVVTRFQRNGHSFSRHQPLYLIISHLWLLCRPIRPTLSKIVKKAAIILKLMPKK